MVLHSEVEYQPEEYHYRSRSGPTALGMPVSGNLAAKPWDGVEGKPTVQPLQEYSGCSVGLVLNGFQRIYRVPTDNDRASKAY